VPDIIAGNGLTVATAVVKQLVEVDVYEMTAVPAARPDKIPVDAPTVAIVVAPLLQVPPVVASEREVVSPWQTVSVPVIGAGDGLIVTTFAA
jgi:hypothetical protein